MFEDTYTNSWEELEEFPMYVINHHAEIVNMRTNRPLSYSRTKDGIVKVNLMQGTRVLTRSVARLMARTFLTSPNPNFTSVIHLDGDKTNCHISNLMLRPRWFVVNYHQQFQTPAFHEDYRRPIRCVDNDKVYPGHKEACMDLGLLFWEINNSINNRTRVYPGALTFEWAE